jgi:hypothetical protein
MVYRVLWEDLWLHLSKYITIAISIPIALMLLMLFLTGHFSPPKNNMTLTEVPIVFICITVFSIIFALFGSLLVSLGAIEIKNGKILGRNYFMMKKEIELTNIQSLRLKSRGNGVDAVVVNGGLSGKIYISAYTEKIAELIELLSGCCTK